MRKKKERKEQEEAKVQAYELLLTLDQFSILETISQKNDKFWIPTSDSFFCKIKEMKKGIHKFIIWLLSKNPRSSNHSPLLHNRAQLAALNQSPG